MEVEEEEEDGEVGRCEDEDDKDRNGDEDVVTGILWGEDKKWKRREKKKKERKIGGQLSFCFVSSCQKDNLFSTEGRRRPSMPWRKNARVREGPRSLHIYTTHCKLSVIEKEHGHLGTGVGTLTREHMGNMGPKSKSWEQGLSLKENVVVKRDVIGGEGRWGHWALQNKSRERKD